MMKWVQLIALVIVFFNSAQVFAFCGFYVAKADAKLFNKVSQVVMVRDENKTVLTMASDYEGAVRDFAMVVPVPTKLEREQIHIGEMALVDHLDAYTGPRLVEYFDPDPCAPPMQRDYKGSGNFESMAPRPAAKMKATAERHGVTIEASYTIGEYDILILSAKQGDGLVQWLTEEKYQIPTGAEPVIDSYLKQRMKWFVAKVNLREHDKLGGGKLRPIQVAYESPKFMLPIRLGTVNSKGTQDIIVYALSRQGRVEATNYKTIRVPSDVNVPEYTKDVFGDFYQSTFSQTVKAHDNRVIVTEYAWDMAWCDPCAADPLSADELRKLGVFWLDGENRQSNVFVTRLHARYDNKSFPEDLVFQSTADRSNFQGRYVMQHAFKGELNCAAADAYRQTVWTRQQEEAASLARLTGWSIDDIKQRMGVSREPPRGSPQKKWFQRLWKD